MESFPELAIAVRFWAVFKPQIAHVWFFGSRVRGADRFGNSVSVNSDLDIAIELDPIEFPPPAQLPSELCEQWHRELRQLTGLEPELHWLPSEDVSAWIGDCSLAVL